MKIPPKLQAALPYALVALGFVQTVGFLAQVPLIRGLGTASMASPLPLVFSAFRGIETFALDFEMRVFTRDGQTRTARVTPELYSRLGGPYNLRNVYGAVISYGAGFTERKELELLDTVLRHGLCNEGPLARQFELPSGIERAQVLVTSKTQGSPGHWTLEAKCSL